MFRDKRSLFKTIAFGAFICSLTACKTLPEEHFYSGSVTENQLINGLTFLGKPLEDQDLPNIDVMSLTP
jgi:hypothetical protein